MVLIDSNDYAFYRSAKGELLVPRDEATIGEVGVLTVATRGDKGPGEVQIKVRGGSECFIAWSDRPLARGTKVLVIDHRGSRSVDVIEWEDS